MSGLQQCMPAIDVPLLVDSADQISMDSDDLVPTLTVCATSLFTRTLRQRYFSVSSSLKDLFKNTKNCHIIDFIKETHFFNLLQCLLYTFYCS